MGGAGSDWLQVLRLQGDILYGRRTPIPFLAFPLEKIKLVTLESQLHSPKRKSQAKTH